MIKLLHPRKTKAVVEFNDRESASIKYLAVKKKKPSKSYQLFHVR